jgi:glycerol-3-phosphate O-acyltransferase/dihydroxyacetone phosphate acyltransferase
MVIELNRRLVKGYERYKDDPRIVNLKKSVLAYNKSLLQLQIRDHQVDYAKLPILKVLGMLIYRLTKLILLSVGVLPGLVLFSPVFIAGKLISIQKSKEALAASTVKVAARDVVATWKLLVSMALAPALYTVYTVILTVWTYKNRISGRVPDNVPLWAVIVFGYVFFPTITYAALRFGEVGMDIVKSLRPLLVALSPWHGSMLGKLRERRTKLAAEVTDLINTLGPEMFPDFDSNRIVADPFRSGDVDIGTPYQEHRQQASEPSTPTSPAGFPFTSFSHFGADGKLPRKDSYKDLSGVGFFASGPPTPYHGRSRSRTNSSNALHVQGFSSLDNNVSFDEVSRKIRGAMRERSARRHSESENRYESGTSTPGSEGDANGLTMSSASKKKTV